VGIDVRVNTIVSRSNRHDLEALLQLTGSLGAKAHSFFYFSPIGRGREIADDWVSPTEYIAFVTKFRSFVVRNKFHEKMAVYLQDGYVLASQFGSPNRIPCRALEESFLVVLADGRVLPCTWFIDTDMALGNVTEESLTQIWKRFIAGQTFFRVDPEECEACAVSGTCRGGCQAASYKWRESMPLKDPRCLDPETFYPGCPEAKVRVSGGITRLPLLGRLSEYQR
jgi:AdoMet-dependent heme synthase